MDFHFESIVEELIDEGHTPDEARLIASRRFGDSDKYLSSTEFERNPVLFCIYYLMFVIISIILCIGFFVTLPFWVLSSLFADSR